MTSAEDRQLARQVLDPGDHGHICEHERPLLEVFDTPGAAGGDGGERAPSDPVVELSIVGELSASTSPLITRKLLGRAPPGGRLVLDLGDVTFCDAAGTRFLLSIQRKLERQRTTLELHPISGAVSRALTMSGAAATFQYRLPI